MINGATSSDHSETRPRPLYRGDRNAKKDRQPTVRRQCGATGFTYLRKEHGSVIYCMPQRLKMKPNKKLDNKLEKLFKHYQSGK
jgi:hypothetical protein